MTAAIAVSIHRCAYCEESLLSRPMEPPGRYARRRFCNKMCASLSSTDLALTASDGKLDTTTPTSSPPPVPQSPAACGHCGAASPFLYFHREMAVDIWVCRRCGWCRY